MAEIKHRRGFKGKVTLRNFLTYDLHEVIGAYEEDGQLFYKLDNGDDFKAEYLHVFDNKIQAIMEYNKNNEQKEKKKE